MSESSHGPRPGVDPYDLFRVDDLLTDAERMVRDSVRGWVERRVRPIIGACYEQARFPRELLPELAELGLFGATLPERYGGAEASHVAYGLAMQELERGDSGLRSFASVQNGLCIYPIYAYGSEQQRERYLPGLCRGELIGCFGLTEADGGSDPLGQMRTRAVRTATGYRISGAKMWITNGSIADLAIVWARLDDGAGADAVHGFIVETDRAGFSAPEIGGKLSLRASVTSELVLDDVELPESARLPETAGLKSALGCLNQARYGIAWGALGAALACYQEALDFAGQRTSFGASLAAKQLVQAKLVEMLAGITQGQLLCWKLGHDKDRGTLIPQQVSLAKRQCVAMALGVARAARDLLGASGITGDSSVMRHLCNLESVSTYEGTHDIQTLILGEGITGARAY